ncbi:MAG: hypothetical protein IKZ87_03320 [Actinomycetaceae bacterium]|nr:hypothetical protein [Actinomycetaceae bacterium]
MKKQLLALAATLTLAASALAGCSTESAEHKEAVEQYQSALQAWNDALADTQEDYEYCMENERNCLAAVTEGYNSLDRPCASTKLGQVTVKECYRDNLEDTRTITPMGSQETPTAIPLSDKDLDEKEGLSIEDIQEATERLENATERLYIDDTATKTAKNTYDSWAKQTIEDISEKIEVKAKWFTANRENLPQEKNKKECDVAWSFDKNKTYTLDEAIDMYNNVGGTPGADFIEK